MWLIAPLIFIVAWVKSHSISQSITESAAWCGGYMAVAGIIIALNMGSIHIISEAPDGPGSILPILGGFLFMWVSHMLWRRRGGHIQRREVPLTRLAGRAYIAFRGNDPARPASRRNSYASAARRASGGARAAATASSRSAPGPSTPPRPSPSPAPDSATPPPRTAASTGASASAGESPSAGRPSTARPAAPRKPASTKKAPAKSKAKIAGRLAAGAGQQVAQSESAQKAMTNRWVRGSVKAMGAFMNDPKKRSKPVK